MKRVAIACWPEVRFQRQVNEINENFALHIERAGALPFLIPITTEGQDLTPYVEHMDGLLLMGGADVSSFLYDEDPHIEAERFNFQRDASEIALFQAARAAGKPVLGICRGMHLINVVLGGTLHQHLPDRNRSVTHGGDYPKRFPFHRVRTLGGRMKELYPDGLIVNSFHHQGLKDVAPGLTVTAEAHDGLPEAVEGDGIFAIQFHPEIEDIQADTSRIYQRFVEEL